MAKTFTPKQQNWNIFIDDAAEPIVALAAENAAAQLNNTGIHRLRLTIAETGGASGSGAVTLQYSTDNSNFTAFGAGNAWNYANGQATDAGTTTTFKTTDGTTHGLYHENGTGSESWAANAVRELDIAIQPTGTAVANTLYYFRAHIAGTEVPLNTGKTHPQATTVPTSVKGRMLGLERNYAVVTQ